MDIGKYFYEWKNKLPTLYFRWSAKETEEKVES